MRRGGVAADDFFGPPLNRCARILAAAHGGQVLLSEEAHRLLSTTSSGGWQVRAMGEHRFKGLGKPQHVLRPARGLSNDFRRSHRPDAGGITASGLGRRSGATSCGNGSGRVTSGSSTAYQPTVGRGGGQGDPARVRQQAGVRPPLRGRGSHRRPAGAPPHRAALRLRREPDGAYLRPAGRGAEACAMRWSGARGTSTRAPPPRPDRSAIDHAHRRGDPSRSEAGQCALGRGRQRVRGRLRHRCPADGSRRCRRRKHYRPTSLPRSLRAIR